VYTEVVPQTRTTRVTEEIPWYHGKSPEALKLLVQEKKAKILLIHRQVTKDLYTREAHIVRKREIASPEVFLEGNNISVMSSSKLIALSSLSEMTIPEESAAE